MPLRIRIPCVQEFST